MTFVPAPNQRATLDAAIASFSHLGAIGAAPVSPNVRPDHEDLRRRHSLSGTPPPLYPKIRLGWKAPGDKGGFSYETIERGGGSSWTLSQRSSGMPIQGLLRKDHREGPPAQRI